MKKFLSLAMLAVMVFCLSVSAMAANDLTGRMEEMRALRTQIWALMSKPMPTAEDRAQLETLKQEYDAKRQGMPAPAAVQKEVPAAVESDKAPTCPACPAADTICQPKADTASCACECPCCKMGKCAGNKTTCEKCCCRMGKCTADMTCCKADKSCCKMGKCAADMTCCKADKSCCRMGKCAADMTCCKEARKACRKGGKRAHRHGKCTMSCPKCAPASAATK